MIDESSDSHQILTDIAESKKCIIKGGEYDLDRASNLLIDDLRAGRLGRISLEKPEE